MRKQLPTKGSMLVPPRQYRTSAAATGVSAVATDNQHASALAAVSVAGIGAVATVAKLGAAGAASAETDGGGAATNLDLPFMNVHVAADGGLHGLEAAAGGCAAGTGKQRTVLPVARLVPEERLTVGCRVIVGGTRRGTLRYCGAVHFASDVWCGVELCATDAAAGGGKNDGSVHDVRYFSCAANAGVFVPLSKVALDKEESLVHRVGEAGAGGSELVACGDSTFTLNGSGCSGSSPAEGDGGDGCHSEGLGEANSVSKARGSHCPVLNATFDARRSPLGPPGADSVIAVGGSAAPVGEDVALLLLDESAMKPSAGEESNSVAELGAAPSKWSVDGAPEDNLSSGAVDSGAGDGTSRDGSLHLLTLDDHSASLCIASPLLLPGNASFGSQPSIDASDGSASFVFTNRQRAADAADRSAGSAEKKALALLELSRKMAAAGSASAGSPLSPMVLLPGAEMQVNNSPLVLSTTLNRSMALFRTPGDFGQAANPEHDADHWPPEDDFASIKRDCLAIANQIAGLSDQSDEVHAGSGLSGTPLSCATPGELATKSSCEALDFLAAPINPRGDVLLAVEVSLTADCNNRENNGQVGSVGTRLDGTFVLSGEASTSGDCKTSGKKQVAQAGDTARMQSAAAAASASVSHSDPIAHVEHGLLDTTVTLSAARDPPVPSSSVPACDHMPQEHVENVDDSFVVAIANNSSLDSLIEFGALQEPDGCSTPFIANGKHVSVARDFERSQPPAAGPAEHGRRPEGGSEVSYNGGSNVSSGTSSPHLNKAAREKQCAAGGATVTRKPAVSKLADYIANGSTIGNADKGLQPAAQLQQLPHIRRNPPRSRWADISKQLEESRATAATTMQPLPVPQQQHRHKPPLTTSITTDVTTGVAPAAASRRMTLAGGSAAVGAPAHGCPPDESGGGSTRDVDGHQQRRRQTMAPSSLKSAAVPAAAGPRSSLIAAPSFKAPLPRPAAAAALQPPAANRKDAAGAAAPATAIVAAAALERSSSVASVSSQASQSSMGAAESASGTDAADGLQSRRRHSLLLSSSSAGSASAAAAAGHAVSRRSLAKSERRLKSPLPSAATGASAAGAASVAGRRQPPVTAARRSTAGPPVPTGESGLRHQASRAPPPLQRGGEVTKVAQLQLQLSQPPSKPAPERSSLSGNAADTFDQASTGNGPASRPDVIPCELVGEIDDGLGQSAQSKVDDGSPARPKDASTAATATSGAAAGDQVDAADTGDSVGASAGEALAAALAQVAEGMERERQLKADGERRELENAHLRSEQRRLATAVSALAVLLQYTIEQLHAFSMPRVAARNEELERRLSAAGAKVGALEAEVSEAAAAMQRTAAEHAARVVRLQDEHVEETAELYAQIEAIKAGFAEEMNSAMMKAGEEKTNLQNKLLCLERERDELCNQYRRVEDALTKDADVKVQLALSPYKHLPKEVESLMTVVDMKNTEIQKLRKENNESKKQLEELRAGCDRVSLLEQRIESLEAAVESRVRSERELQERYDELARRCEQEAREKLRLSMNCEELQYRLQDVTCSSAADYSAVGSPAAMQRSFAFASPRVPAPAWSSATMTTSLYEPLTSSPSSDIANGVRLRRSQSSGVTAAGGAPPRRRLSYEREQSLVPAAPPSTPSLPEQHESTDGPSPAEALPAALNRCGQSTLPTTASDADVAVPAAIGAAASVVCSVDDRNASSEDVRLQTEPTVSGSTNCAGRGTASSSVAADAHTADSPGGGSAGEQVTAVHAATGGAASPSSHGSPTHGSESTKRLQPANGSVLRTVPSPLKHSPSTETDV